MDRRRKKKPCRTLRKWLKRRAAIEPIVGHLKFGHRMSHNRYRGQSGDAVNASLSDAGFNFRKLLAFFLVFFAGTLLPFKSAWPWPLTGKPAHATP